MGRVRIRRPPPNTYELLLNLTNRHIHAQLVNRSGGRVITAAHTTEPCVRAELCPRAETPGASYATASVAAARLIGLQVGKRAAQRGVNVVLWDRPGKYHGKIKAFIDAVRECGVQTRMAMRKEMPGEQKV